MMIGLEWVAQKFFIACRMSMQDRILTQEPVDVLLDAPDAYFALGPLKGPSQPIRDYIHISIEPGTDVGIDTRNMGSIRDWSYVIDGSEPIPLPANTDIMPVGVEPQLVKFLFRGKVHTTFQFFVELPPSYEGNED